MIKNFLTPYFLVAILLAGFSSFLIYQKKFEAGMAGAGASIAAATANAKKKENSKEEEEKELIFDRELSKFIIEVLIEVQTITGRALNPDEIRELVDLLICLKPSSPILETNQNLEENNQQLKSEVALLQQKLEDTKKFEYLRGQHQAMQNSLRDPNYLNILQGQKIEENNQRTSGFLEQNLGGPKSIDKSHDDHEQI
ncbi:MAG: hypothetical protein ACRCU2_16760 [Planktothrix sp.]